MIIKCLDPWGWDVRLGIHWPACFLLWRHLVQQDDENCLGCVMDGLAFASGSKFTVCFF